MSSEPSKDISEILPGFSNIREFTQNGLQALMENIRSSSGLPSGHKWDYFTSFSSFKKIMDSEGKQVLKLMNLILQHQGINGNILRRDIEEKFELLVDANDQMFERVGNALDEISGIRKNPEPVLVEASGTTRAVSGSWNKNMPSKSNENVSLNLEPQSVRLLTAKNIERPQSKFHDKIDNSNNPWEPRIKDKPNSLKPLAIFLEECEEGECYCHPYEFELDRFSPSEDQLKPLSPSFPKTLEETPLVMVEKPEDIPQLLKDLEHCKTFAVDLEHHSYRTFQGFACLMQISTPEKDYIIDTISLRSDLHVLNSVFTNPKILKVFHDASSDILWLQRDLSLYVVNMFDTYQAAKALNFAGLSFAFLMRHFCKLDPNKHFQLADWRIRPLPEELKVYARSDTHYLLYIYECLNNALLEAANGQQNLLQAVYQRSTEVCKRKYVKKIFQDDSHLELYRKSKKMFDNRQMTALQHMYKWRDQIAREEDESIGYVLPNHMLLHICELLPREIQGILSCCNPIPPLVRQHLLELHQIVLRARDQPLVKPVVEEELRQRPVAETWAKMSLDDPLHCPHDLKFEPDFRDDLPTLLKPLENSDTIVSAVGNKLFGSILSEETNTSSLKLVLADPKINFDSLSNSLQADVNEEERLKIKKRFCQVNFLSPFERYKKIRPYTDSLRKEKLKQHEKEMEEKKQEDNHASSTSVTKELSNEERILRMQEEIRAMTSKTSSTPSKEKTKNSPRKEEEICAITSKTSSLPSKEKTSNSPARDSMSKRNLQSNFQPHNYQEEDFSRFHTGQRKTVSQNARSHGRNKKHERGGKHFKASVSKATRGLSSSGGSNSRNRGRNRGRGRPWQ